MAGSESLVFVFYNCHSGPFCPILGLSILKGPTLIGPYNLYYQNENLQQISFCMRKLRIAAKCVFCYTNKGII